MKGNENIESRLKFIPAIGVVLFVLLYLVSAMLYPGGSQIDPNSVGFDWMNNYWCNLMNEDAMNGARNPARSYAVVAMIILCLSLMAFFVRFARTFPKSRIWRLIIGVAGILSMSSAMFISTKYHDVMTTVSSVFGLFAIVGVMREIYLSNMKLYKLGGGLCILLIAINNYIYYSGDAIEFLPLLQKITFGIVLIWILRLNVEMNKREA